MNQDLTAKGHPQGPDGPPFPAQMPSGIHILIVDVKSSSRERIEKLLRECGYDKVRNRNPPPWSTCPF